MLKTMNNKSSFIAFKRTVRTGLNLINSNEHVRDKTQDLTCQPAQENQSL
jgi:hypothetical protein